MTAAAASTSTGLAARPWSMASRLLLAAVLIVPVERAPPAMQTLVLVALLLGGWTVGWAAAGWLTGWLPRAERAFAAAAMGVAACVVIGEVIGHFGALTSGWFRGVLAAIVVVSALPRRGGSRPLERAHPSMTLAPRWWTALRLRAPLRWRRLQRTVLWASLLLVVGLLLRTAVQQRHAPPGHFSFDDTSYHLTAVATWNVHGDLRMPRFTFGDPRTAFYPFASELLAWELTTPFAGGDFAARWIELPFALLTLVGLALVASRLGAGESALLAPLLYTTVSEAYPEMAFTAGNDHALAFASVVAVHGALLLRRRPCGGVGAYAGVGLGLMLATKYLAVIYAPLWVAIVTIAVLTARQGESARSRVAALAALGATALAVGGYAYLRNLVTTGNPIFPVALSIGPWKLPGWDDVAPALWGKTALDFDPWQFLWTRRDAFGAVFRWTMLPAAVLAPLAALAFAPARRRLLYVWSFAMPLGVYLLFARLVEDHRGVRYLLPGIAITAAGVAWLVSRLPWRVRGVVATALAVVSAARWVGDEPRALWALPVLLAVGWAVARRPRWEPTRYPARTLLAGIAGALVLAALAPTTMRKYDQRRYHDLQAAAAFEQLTGAAPARLLYSGWNQPYLFCGRRLRNVLYMLPATRGGETAFYRWRGGVEEPSATQPRRAWERQLDRLRIDWVVWAAAGEGIRPERDWMLRSPDRFARVYGDERAEIWQVRH